ncbi:MAG TPA: TonB-dependent receptor [Terriglobia bacterium]|nr:TonB-dependent receptor [Terriglobia bacterium]
MTSILRRQTRLLVLMILILTPVFRGTLNGQEARGTITGRVTDATNAIIQGASVKVTNVAQGTVVSLVSNEAGLYRAPYLSPGTYQVAAEAPGFSKHVRDGVSVRINETIEINVQLELGEVQETVTVVGDAPLLDTAGASAGQSVDSRRISELPMPHGEPYNLIGLSAGVAFARDPRLDRPFEPTHIVGYAMGGTRANRSDLTIDGSPSTATANPNEVISTYVPPPDIIAEFKVQTTTFDASFGNTEGGVTNISLKSGTNALHGTGYFTKMVPGLFANDYFANANRIERPDFYYNRWGTMLGGPVVLPKLYNGKNKTFFMWGYEGIHEARPRNDIGANGTVPTEKMRKGDFSELLALGPQYQIYNPFTRRAVGGGRYQQDPFPNNIVPSNLIDPVARNIVDTYWPLPLTQGNADFTNNLNDPTLKETITYYTHTIKIDHVVSDRQRVFVRGSWYKRASDYNNYFGNAYTGTVFQFLSRAGTIDDVYTLNPTTVLNVRYGYNRFVRSQDGNPESYGMDLTKLGFPASYANLTSPDIRRMPRFDITGYYGNGFTGEYRPVDTHAVNATINKAKGSHFLKTGMEFRSYRENDTFTSNDQTGRFNFDSTWTRGPLDNSANAPGSLGQSFAAFLLGLPTGGNNGYFARTASYAEQSLTWGLFVHDDWKVNSKLTLNLGLRYEFESPLTERYNRSVSGLDFNAIQPIEAQVRAKYALNPTPEIPADQFNVRGGLLFPSEDSRGLYETPKKNFMPRFGFAYKLTEKTVLRGGYGIFYGFLGQRRGDVSQHGFSRNTNLVPSTTNGLTFRDTLSNPFQGGVLEPVGSSQGIETFLGHSITFFNQPPSTSYNQRWELGLQRELGAGFVVEGSYIGNRGTHIETFRTTDGASQNRNLNVTPQRYLSTSPVRDNVTDAYLTQNIPNPFFGILPATTTIGASANIARERLLRPYPQFDQVFSTTNDGYSWYHSLQVRLEKRFSKGYTFLGAYTYSKFMQATQYLNQDDLRPSEVISDVDFPHRISLSGIYELPFGKGKPVLNGANSVVEKIVGGWQLSGIYSYQSGGPIGGPNGGANGWAYNNVPGSGLIFTGDFKDIALPSDQRTIERWFNTDAGFVKTANQQRTARQVRTFPIRFSFLRGDNINNTDLSVIKKTDIREGKILEFRAEFINAFNHPFFNTENINIDPTSASFGRFVSQTQRNYARRIQMSLKFTF